MRKVLTILSVFFYLNAGSSNYYISAAGNDAAAGTITAPWKTSSKVNSSMSLFNPGDSILFRGGDTFSQIIPGKSGVLGNNIIICSYGNGKAIISATNNPSIYVTASRGYWTIHNLNLKTSGSASGVGAPQSLCIYFNYWPSEMGAVPGWEIKNCTLNGQILVSGPDMWIHNNLLDGRENAATNVGGAVVIRAANGRGALIEYNDISNWKDRGVWIMEGVDTFTVRYNYIHNIKVSTDQNGAGINSDGAGRPNPHGKIYGNKIDTVGYGVSLERAFYNEVYENDLNHCSQIGITMFTYAPNLADPHFISIHDNVIKNTPLGIVNFNTSTISVVNNNFPGTGTNAFNVQFNSGNTANHITFANNTILGQWIHPIQISSDVANLWDQFDYNSISGEQMFVMAGSISRNLATVQAMGYQLHPAVQVTQPPADSVNIKINALQTQLNAALLRIAILEKNLNSLQIKLSGLKATTTIIQ